MSEEAETVSSSSVQNAPSSSSDTAAAPPPVETDGSQGGAPTGGPQASSVGAKPDASSANDLMGDINPMDQIRSKVVVHNIKKYMKPKNVDKMVSSWISGHESTIKVVKSKKPPKDNWIKLTLEDESMVDKLIELINKGGDNGNPRKNDKGQPLLAKRADDMFRNDRAGGEDGDRKRKSNGDGGDTAKRSRHNPPPVRILSKDEVRDKITPLWRLSYKDQLDKKAREMVNKSAMKIVKEIKAKFRTIEKEARRDPNRSKIQVYDWVKAKRPVEMDAPTPSPRQFEYRNKCEFTCGFSLSPKNGSGADKDEGKEVAANGEADDASAAEDEFVKTPACGFLAQGWSGGVYMPHTLPNIPDWACGLSDILNEFLRTSPIPPYDSKVHRGLWRVFTLRCSLRTKEALIIVLHAPAKGGAGARDGGLDDYTGTFESEKKRLVEMLTKEAIPAPTRDLPESHVSEPKGQDGADVRVTSIFFQEFDGLSHPPVDHPVQHVFGKKTLDERLGKCTFQISPGKFRQRLTVDDALALRLSGKFDHRPGAFFQTNTEGAEVLYNIVVDRVKEVTDDPKETMLVDVCCGTGTIGLTLLKEGVVGKLVGVDIAAPAIEDAKVNAVKNGFADESVTKFVASPAETVMPGIMHEIPRTSPVVAVVDPAREGLHGIVVKALRANERIERLVYVSCNPTGSLVKDASMLCCPPTKKYPGRPFRITRSQPVDMFPLVGAGVDLELLGNSLTFECRNSQLPDLPL